MMYQNNIAFSHLILQPVFFSFIYLFILIKLTVSGTWLRYILDSLFYLK